MADIDRNVDPRDQWQNKLFKLLPAEFTGLFLLARTLADTQDIGQDKNVYILFFILIIILPLFNYFVLSIGRLWKQNVVICISFFVWCVNIELFRLKRGIALEYIAVDPKDIDFWVPIFMGLWVAILLPLIFAKQNWEDEFFRSKQQPP